MAKEKKTPQQYLISNDLLLSQTEVDVQPVEELNALQAQDDITLNA